MFRVVVFLFVTRVFAQDAGQVLGLSVTERTLRNTVKLLPAKQEEVDRLSAAAAKANAAGNYSEAFKDMKHAITLLNGGEWTPTVAWTTALGLKSDHSILEPGQFVSLTLSQSFKLDGPLKQHPYATAYLTPFYAEQPR